VIPISEVSSACTGIKFLIRFVSGTGLGKVITGCYEPFLSPIVEAVGDDS
jgi:hypothetical protein